MNTPITHDVMTYAVGESRARRYMSSVLVGDLAVFRITDSESTPANGLLRAYCKDGNNRNIYGSGNDKKKAT